jgi:hypothetical protein
MQYVIPQSIWSSRPLPIPIPIPQQQGAIHVPVWSHAECAMSYPVASHTTGTKCYHVPFCAAGIIHNPAHPRPQVHFTIHNPVPSLAAGAYGRPILTTHCRRTSQSCSCSCPMPQTQFKLMCQSSAKCPIHYPIQCSWHCSHSKSFCINLYQLYLNQGEAIILWAFFPHFDHLELDAVTDLK